VEQEERRSFDKGTRSGGEAAENGISPGEWNGAFERCQKAVSEQAVKDMPLRRAAFSREGPLSARLVIWLMIFQRLDANGSLSSAVCHLLTGPARELVREPEGAAAPSLSANTSAYSQARCKLPLEVAEQVSQLIFESLQEQPRTLPGLERPVFLLDGSTILPARSPALEKAYPPQRNQHGASHWPDHRRRRKGQLIQDKVGISSSPMVTRAGGTRCDQRAGCATLLGASQRVRGGQ
jgi:hypothetical protein